MDRKRLRLFALGGNDLTAIQFLEGGGETVYITTSERFHETVKGKAGTKITAR
jgi:carbamate kinase